MGKRGGSDFSIREALMQVPREQQQEHRIERHEQEIIDQQIQRSDVPAQMFDAHGRFGRARAPLLHSGAHSVDAYPAQHVFYALTTGQAQRLPSCQQSATTTKAMLRRAGDSCLAPCALSDAIVLLRAARRCIGL